MSATLLPSNQALPGPQDQTQTQQVLFGTVTLAGNYGVANGHGDILDMAGFGDLLKSDQLPTSVFIYEEPVAGQAPTGFTFLYARGTNQNNGKILVFQNQGAGNPNAEITQGNAYPASLLAATPTSGISVIKVEATFPYAI